VVKTNTEKLFLEARYFFLKEQNNRRTRKEYKIYELQKAIN